MPFDADEAVEGIAALHIVHGHFILMEANARYLGAFDSYILAPFVAVFGPTVLAIRVAGALVGAAYTAAMFPLGGAIFRDSRKGLVLAAIAAVFPLFALTFGVKARTYGVLLLLEALMLLLAVRIAWPAKPATWRDWGLLGLVAGLAAWHDVLLAIPLLVCALLIVARAPAIGWAIVWRGGAVAVVAALVGFSPWIVYNLHTRLGSLRHLYTPLSTYSVSTVTAIRQVLDAALPIFVGARVNFCGPATIPTPSVDLALALLAAGVVWVRRRSARAALRGEFGTLEPVDWILLIAPLSVLAVTVHWFNGLSCEPRYLMPLAVPLVVAVAVIAFARHPGRAILLLALAGCLAISASTLRTSANLYRDVVVVPGAPPARLDLAQAARALERERPEAIWADYWLARPIQYLAQDRIIVGEYGGYVGFPETQAAALAASRPSWLFVAGDPEIGVFSATCARRGITFRETSPVDGLVLFANLSQRLVPEDLGIRTQSVGQAA